jgi:threonylcarbamoyladenosine tRNA methylthiotransferase MtaB
MRRKFRIITLGCKVNQYESTYLREALLRRGWAEASKGEKADASIVNTCIVTQRASYQSRQAVRKAIRENPSGIAAAVGCYGQVFPQELLEIDGLDLVLSNTTKGRLPDLLEAMEKHSRPCLMLEEFSESPPFEFFPVKGASDRTRAFLKIQEGCEAFCSYCIVPFARGPLRSLDPRRVLVMLNELCRAGYKEVVLTGIHLGKYGIDLSHGTDLAKLLVLIGQEKLPLRVRLSSLEPNELHRDLIAMVASEDWLCRHFHIPLQSGDRDILEAMNRHYEPARFAELVEEIHEKIPRAAIGVDVMAGFPGEDEQAYLNTYELISDLPVSYLHIFPYSPRRGTAASELPDQVLQGIVKERTSSLRALGQEKRDAFYRSCLGHPLMVLSEGWESEPESLVKGWSDNYLKVLFESPEPLKNHMIPVIAERLHRGGILGRVVDRFEIPSLSGNSSPLP